MATPEIKVDFTSKNIDPKKENIEIKGSIGFELHNRGLSDLVVEGITLKRGDMQVFTPPIPGAVFATNKRYTFSNPATADAILIVWAKLPEVEC